MEWTLFNILEILYIIPVLAVVIKILLDTSNSTKAIAYILLILLLPIVGIIIYLSFGINYRKQKLYNKKLKINRNQSEHISGFIRLYQTKHLKILQDDFPSYFDLSRMFSENNVNFATNRNKLKLLINGDEKFPELLKALRAAKHHIHMAYYIYENDVIGNKIADILIEKARQGVEVRFIYDDFGSYGIRKSLASKLKENGVSVYPFYKIKFIYLANRMNYRNHRKIVVVDGKTGFVGGINVADKYCNNTTEAGHLFWRDTHLKIEGEGVWGLQNIFFADWNFCSGEYITRNQGYFQNHQDINSRQWVQIVSSGPDSTEPNILYSYLSAINNSKNELLLTTPYFAPGNEFLSALKMAVMRGVNVKLLVPGESSDSHLVNAISKSHYENLLRSGVEIYVYEKGFVHAKTMVCDQQFSVIGTANLDHRSFDLNFEINGLVYDYSIAESLRKVFYHDLENSKQLDLESWHNRSKVAMFMEKILRLAEPLV